jgi:amino acid transporter
VGSVKKSLGSTSLICLVIANMVGAGVFTTSGFALADLGTPHRVMAAWVIGGVIALCGALSYGALARRMSESGGEYLFLSRAVHPALGFLAGWISLLAGFTGAIAFVALAFEAYLLPDLLRPHWLPEKLPAVLVVVLAGLLHGWRMKLGALSQNIAVAIKIGLLLALIGYSLSILIFTEQQWLGVATLNDQRDVSPFSFSAFAVSVMWISLSYSGFNAAIYVAGEAADARRQVPRALFVGTAAVTVIYIALNALFVYAPAGELIVGQKDVAARAAAAIGGAPLEQMVRMLIALALITSVSSMVMAGPRVYARMGDDGLFPKRFRIDGEVPRASIALQVALAAGVIMLSTLQQLLSYLGFLLSISAAVTVASLFLLRRREGSENVPVPGYPYVPLLFVVSTLVFAMVAAIRQPLEPLAAALTIGLGLLAYRFVRPGSRIG